MSGGGKETPRQAMIGMMYLFYTALLALNVSAEILTAFTLVDGSLRKTNAITEDVIAGSVAEFVKAEQINPKGVGPVKELADQVVVEADKAYDEIQKWKEQLVFTLEGVSSMEELYAKNDLNYEEAKNEHYFGDLVSKKDDNNVGGQLFITEQHSTDIKKSREAYREFLIGILNKDTSSAEVIVQARKKMIESISMMLSTEETKSESDEGEMVPWEVANFEHLPAAGVLSLMTKMQSDVRNTESSMLTYLLGQIGKSDMKFNAIKAVVNSPKSYVLVGEEYKAEIFIAAYDSTQNPDIYVGDTKIDVQNGVGIYKGSTAGVGNKSFGGIIKLKNNATGEVKDYPFKGEYEVGQPSCAISPTAMNVLYIGVDNPLEVAASGYNPDKLSVSISAGSVNKAAGTGKYVAKVKTPGKVTVSVSCDGKKIGSQEFRVKTVPNPVAKVAGKKDGTISKAELAAQLGVKAELENFDFNMNFTVKGFTVSAMIKGFEKEETSQTASFTPGQKSLISQLSPGSRVTISNIKAAGPDGGLRELGAISFKIR